MPNDYVSDFEELGGVKVEEPVVVTKVITAPAETEFAATTVAEVE